MTDHKKVSICCDMPVWYLSIQVSFMKNCTAWWGQREWEEKEPNGERRHGHSSAALLANHRSLESFCCFGSHLCTMTKHCLTSSISCDWAVLKGYFPRWCEILCKNAMENVILLLERGNISNKSLLWYLNMIQSVARTEVSAVGVMKATRKNKLLPLSVHL